MLIEFLCPPFSHAILLRFFRINDPFRLILIFLILCISRGLILWLGVPLSIPELNWLVIGERMSDGHHLYTGLVDDIAPLSATVYWILYTLFGKSVVAYHLLAILIAAIQIVTFNNLLIKYKSLSENTYVPALVLTLLYFVSFDFLMLSPAFMSLTLVILVLDYLLEIIQTNRASHYNVLISGLLLGIATLFYLPAGVLLLVVILSYLFYTGNGLQYYLLFIASFIQPLFVAGLYYYWIDGFEEYANYFLIGSLTINAYEYVTLDLFLFIFGLPTIYLFLGLFSTLFSARGTVNQQKQKQIFLMFMLAMALSVFLANKKTPYQFILMLPAVAFFITNFLLNIKRKLFSSIAFYLFVLGMLGNFYFSKFVFFREFDDASISSFFVSIDEKYQRYAGKKILVIGEDLNYYQNAKLATPYLEYRLTRQLLNDTQDVKNLLAIIAAFEADMPEVVIDEKGLFPKLRESIPLLNERYQRSLTTADVYLLKKD